MQKKIDYLREGKLITWFETSNSTKNVISSGTHSGNSGSREDY